MSPHRDVSVLRQRLRSREPIRSKYTGLHLAPASKVGVSGLVLETLVHEALTYHTIGRAGPLLWS